MRASDQGWDIAVHYTGWSRIGTRSGREADVRAVRSLASDFSAHRLKADCAWNLVETADGVFDFSWVDHVCAVGARAGLCVTLILNSYWGAPDWLNAYDAQKPFCLNARGETGRQGQTEGSAIGRYPAPPILCGSSAWLQKRMDRWRAELIQHVESHWPGLVDEYVCEGEIYLNPDNETGDNVMDYNPHTVALFRMWLRLDRSSPYFRHPSPARGARPTDITVNDRWGRKWTSWDELEPPRSLAAEDPATIDWLGFREYLVARWYSQSAAGVRRCTRARITTLINTFLGIPMPGGHVWSPSRTGNRLWSIFRAVQPYVTSLGVTAYAYDPEFNIDVSGRWQASLMFLQGCARALHRPVRIVEGGSIMRARTASDLRWQLYCSRALGHQGVVLGYFGMPPGQNRNYDWEPARAFSDITRLCRGFVDAKQARWVRPSVLVVYGADTDRARPFDSVEALAVRAACRHLRDAGLPFEVVDSASIEAGNTRLTSYRGVVVPHSAVLPGRCIRQLAVTPVLATSEDAGRLGRYGEPQQGLWDLRRRPAVLISAPQLAEEQSQIEAGINIEQTIRPWVRQLAEAARLTIRPSAHLVEWAPGWWFNRSAEEFVTAPDSERVPPGQEHPAVCSMSGVEAMVAETGEWRVWGASAGTVSETTSGLCWRIDARGAPPAYWEARLYRAVAGLPFDGRIELAYCPVGPGWKADVRLSVIAWNARNGRVYTADIPVGEQSRMDVSISRTLQVPNASRAAEITHIGLCLEGAQWPALELCIRTFQIEERP